MQYTEEQKLKAVKEVLNLVREGESFRASIRILSKEDEFPVGETVRRWISDSDDLSMQYAHACEEREDFLFDQILSISDETGNDKIYLEDREVTDNEAIQRSKLRVDSRKWVLSKMNKVRFGDSIQQDVKVTQEQPLFPDVK